MRIFAFILFLFPTLAFADSKIEITPLTTNLSAVSCISTVAAATRTATIDVGKIGPSGKALPMVVVGIEHVYNASATVTMTCTASNDDGTTDYKIQDCTMASGTCTSNDLSWSKASGAASSNWMWRIDSTGFVRLECTLLCSGAGTDTVTVKTYSAGMP